MTDHLTLCSEQRLKELLEENIRLRQDVSDLYRKTLEPAEKIDEEIEELRHRIAIAEAALSFHDYLPDGTYCQCTFHASWRAQAEEETK